MGSIDEVNMAGALLTGPSILSLINCLMMMILSAKFVLCLLDRTFCCVALESGGVVQPLRDFVLAMGPGKEVSYRHTCLHATYVSYLAR